MKGYTNLGLVIDQHKKEGKYVKDTISKHNRKQQLAQTYLNNKSPRANRLQLQRRSPKKLKPK